MKTASRPLAVFAPLVSEIGPWAIQVSDPDGHSCVATARNTLREEDSKMLSLIRKVVANRGRQRLRRITIDQLSALDDVALRDIGVERSQIRSVAESLFRETEPKPRQANAHVVPNAMGNRSRRGTAPDFEQRVAA